MSKLFNKYTVYHADGSPIDPNAQYFVLRIDNDPAARWAVRKYAELIGDKDPLLAAQLMSWVTIYEEAHRKKTIGELGY